VLPPPIPPVESAIKGEPPKSKQFTNNCGEGTRITNIYHRASGLDREARPSWCPKRVDHLHRSALVCFGRPTIVLPARVDIHYTIQNNESIKPGTGPGREWSETRERRFTLPTHSPPQQPSTVNRHSLSSLSSRILYIIEFFHLSRSHITTVPYTYTCIIVLDTIGYLLSRYRRTEDLCRPKSRDRPFLVIPSRLRSTIHEHLVACRLDLCIHSPTAPVIPPLSSIGGLKDLAITRTEPTGTGHTGLHTFRSGVYQHPRKSSPPSPSFSSPSLLHPYFPCPVAPPRPLGPY